MAEGNRVLLLSIYQPYADMIFDGTKKVELRRVRPNVASGDIVLVYTPSPTMKLVGEFQVDRVLEGRPATIWAKVKNFSGITRVDFDQYYEGAAVAFGIIVRKAWRLDRPIELAVLRQIWSGFSPPQGYRYLRSHDVSKIRRKRISIRASQTIS